MKIIPCEKATVCFTDIDVTELFEDKDGHIYMRIKPVNIADVPQMGTFNAMDMNDGRYASFHYDALVTPVYGSFHRKENPNG